MAGWSAMFSAPPTLIASLWLANVLHVEKVSARPDSSTSQQQNKYFEKRYINVYLHVCDFLCA
jgi:hypothetical protein